MAFSSYLIADFVMDEANRRFAPQLRPVPERLEIFKQYCSCLDRMIEEFDGTSLEVEIDEEGTTVHMRLELKEFALDNREHSLYRQLLERTVSVHISRVEDSDGIRLCLVFPSLWDIAK